MRELVGDVDRCVQQARGGATTTTVEVRGTGADEVVSALKATLHPGVGVRKVASPATTVPSDTRRRLEVCAVVKDGATEVAQFAGIVEVVPKVQLPLSVREKAVNKVRVEFDDIAIRYRIVRDQLYENGIPNATATGRWDSDSVYACYMPQWNGNAWYVLEFYANKTAKSGVVSTDPALTRPTASEIQTEISNGSQLDWEGTLPSGIP